ncbi:unnamed protein product [Chrysoparadoxa australica]
MDSSCVLHTTCAGCQELYQLPPTEEEQGPAVVCTWCDVGRGNLILPACVDAADAKNVCTPGTVIDMCHPSYASYLFVLVLGSSLSCCCALILLRRVLGQWASRRSWSGGDLNRPLLEEDEGSHEAVFCPGDESATWKCPICSFGNRHSSSQCDLCGTCKSFASAYSKKKMKHLLALRGKRVAAADEHLRGKEERDAIEEEQEGVDASASASAARETIGNRVGESPPPQSAQIYEGSCDAENEECHLLAPVAATPPIPAVRRRRTLMLPDDDDDEREHDRDTKTILPCHLIKLTERQKKARRRGLWQKQVGENGAIMWFRSRQRPGERSTGSTSFGGSGSSGRHPHTITPPRMRDLETGERHQRDEAHVDSGVTGSSSASGIGGSSLDDGTSGTSNDRAQGGVTGAKVKARAPPKSHLSPPWGTPHNRRDSFGDEGMESSSPGYFSSFLEGGELAWEEAGDGAEVVMPLVGDDEDAATGSHTNASTRGSSAAETERSSGGQGQGNGGGNSGGGGSGVTSATEWLRSLPLSPNQLIEVSQQPFWQKHVWLLDQLRLLQVPYGGGMEAMRIEVHRHNLLEDSFTQVMAMTTGELRRWLRVQFVNEPGVDAGGLEREWFLLISGALFDPAAGLFTFLPNGTYMVNPASGIANEMHLDYFRFTGRVLGKLIMEHSVAPYSLALPLLKHLLSVPITFSDLEFVDAQLYNNLRWMKKHQVTESLGVVMSIATEHFGAQIVYDLVPGGGDIHVTDANKDEYLKLRLKHVMLDSIKSQLWNLRLGFYEVVPWHIISVFDYQELEYLLAGIPQIDVADWKANTSYYGEYRWQGERHPVIQWFWDVVENELTAEERARLLQFCTGSSRLPPHGFKALQSNDGNFRQFSIQSIRRRDTAWPRGSTCFNKLYLPVYTSRDELLEFVSVVGKMICDVLTASKPCSFLSQFSVCCL